MKRLFVLIAVLVTSASAQLRTNVPVAWNYDTNVDTSGYVFILYHSTNMSVPLTNWTVLTNIPGTNRQYTIPIQQGEHYFYLITSNWWGTPQVSPPSNIASTPPLPVNVPLKTQP